MLKRFMFLIAISLFSLQVFAQETKAMSQFIVHFELGASWDKSLPPQQQPKFAEHSQNLNRLRKQNVIVFGARYSDLGVIIVEAESLAAAEAIISVDPGIQSGIFNYKIAKLNVFYPWKK